MYEIIIITAVFPPEPVVSARLAWDLASDLVEKNKQVTVLCPQPSRPLNHEYGSYINEGSPTVSEEGGINVVRLPSFTSPRSRFLSRLFESYSFGRHACRYLRENGLHPDVLYVNSWPLLGQALIGKYVKDSGVPMVLQIMDIYPESLLNRIPRLVSKLISLPLLKLDEWIAHQATFISVISDNMRSVYIDNRNMPSEKVVTINLWQDEALFEPLPDRRDACLRYDVNEDLFSFLYLGNIGPVAGVDFLIRAFQKANLESAQLLIVGGGSSKAECEYLATYLGAKNIRFISDPDVNNVSLLQSMADICILPLKGRAGLSSIPSKLPAYMFSAKPVLATVDFNSDTARTIVDAQCGWIGEPEDENWLISKMTELVSLTREQLSEKGQRGLEYSRLHFSKRKGVERLSGVILKSVSNA